MTVWSNTQDQAARDIGVGVYYLIFFLSINKPKDIHIQFSIEDLFQNFSGGFSGDSFHALKPILPIKL